jgi:hypothetical protein
VYTVNQYRRTLFITVVIDALKEIKQSSGHDRDALTGTVRKDLREKLAFGVLKEEFCEKPFEQKYYPVQSTSLYIGCQFRGEGRLSTVFAPH